MWGVQRGEVVLKVEQAEAFGLLKEIPAWLLNEGSKAGNIVLDRRPLEELLNMDFRPRRRRLFRC